MDGNRADRKGAITGGFVESSRSTLDAALHYQRSLDELDLANQTKLQATKTIEDCEVSVTRIMNAIQLGESKLSSLRDQHEPFVKMLSSKRGQLYQTEDLIKEKVSG